jgi:acyl-CoA thioesterase II
MAKQPGVLEVRESQPGRWAGPHPETDPEGRDVVFSGQILAQMIMASDGALEGAKEVKSIHAIFARAGSYSAGPVELALDPMHSGRAWASHALTAFQGERLLSRGLVLLNSVEPDVMRHGPAMPEVPGPEDCPPKDYGVVFPDAEVRLVDRPDAVSANGSPVMAYWLRTAEPYESVAVNQAIVAWSQPGFIIGAAMRAHSDTVKVSDAHKSLSTGVISHTAHFHEHADVSDWLLFVHEGSYAGHGRVFGRGEVFTREGGLVSSFAQDSMVRLMEGDGNWKRSM